MKVENAVYTFTFEPLPAIRITVLDAVSEEKARAELEKLMTKGMYCRTDSSGPFQCVE